MLPKDYDVSAFPTLRRVQLYRNVFTLYFGLNSSECFRLNNVSTLYALHSKYSSQRLRTHVVDS